MDSITQIALGAAVAGALLGRRSGRKALLLGGIVGTLPDLDVVIPYGDAVSNFTYHRGFTHAIIFNALITFPLAWIFAKIKYFNLGAPDRRLNLTIFMVLLTHILLDAMTIYGTQLFWPLPVAPAGVGSMFIIDPSYTLSLLIGIIAFIIRPQTRKIITGALVISTLYLAWSVGAQAYIKNMTMARLPAADKAAHILVQPTALNTLLWRVLIVHDDEYKVGYYSVFDDTPDITFKTYESDKSLITPIEESFAVQRLDWFTKGFYSVTEENGYIYMTDLRMGMEPANYVFRFRVGARDDSGAIISVPNRIERQERGERRLGLIWRRIWNPFVEI